MTNQSSNFKMNAEDLEEHNVKHVDIAYSYTEKFLEEKSKSIDSINSRMMILLGFSGLILRFSLGLPGCEWYTLILKDGVVFMAAFSCIGNAVGLMANPTGVSMSPDSLASSQWENTSIPNIKNAVIEDWLKALEDYEKSEKKKTKCLNCAISMMIIAVILSGLDILLN